MSIFDHYVAVKRSTFYIIRPKLMFTITNFIGLKNLKFDKIMIFGDEKRRWCSVSLMDPGIISNLDHFFVVQ